ncbi:lysozyme family protein [Acetobacter lovaniensis]|uniref:Transglycosylase SLT domain-containing protein n=1 Tax=Acetobacter lovaniensis TaxID=104100 RepID=A0A841QG52_9PROT|nr:hypothetical protein [Acetobacter lovaniensis]MBB6458009.1 hypothetical protein [Acetobacter lovaniensis]NHN82264.1 hypothetical protein [Acetobacter lovaniensis]GBQ72928.1 hypothetical protein AA0474_2820 [Acetobacter lovaniensis NRIC 0474]
MASFIWGANGEEVTPEEIEQRKQIAQSLLGQSQQTPATNWAQGAANMLDSFMGGFMQGRAMKAERANDDYNKAMVAALSGDGAFGGSGTDARDPQVNPYLGSDEAMKLAGPQAQSDPFSGAGTDVSNPVTRDTEAPPGISPVAHALLSPAQPTVGQAAQAGATDLITQHFLDHMRQAESGGNANATNPNSSATGAYQFTNPTWTELMRQHPDLGLTADGRTDPAQSQVAAKQLATDNLAYMLAHGVQSPTEGQAYLAHFAGAPTATNLVQADPNTPISQIMSPQQVAANPFLRNMTAGQVQDWAAQKMGGSGTPPAQAQQTQFPANNYTQAPDMAPPQAQAGPSMSALMGVLADPRANQQTRGVASALLQNQLQLQQVQQRYQMEQADPENVARRRYYDMETARMAQQMNAPQKQGPAYSVLSPQQAQQMGLDPSKSYQQDATGKVMQIGNSGVNVTLNNGPTTSEFQKKSDDEAATRIGGYITEGAQAPALIGQLQQLSDLSRNIGTGKGAQFMAAVGPYAQALGVNVKGLDQQQAFTALVNRMAPQMRPVGSGSSSDTDVRMFMNSLPQLGNTDRGNQIIAGTMQALQQNKLQAAEIAAQAQRGQISWQDAESQIRKLPNPYEQFKKAHADLVSVSQPNQAAPQSGTRTTSSGVTWSVR